MVPLRLPFVEGAGRHPRAALAHAVPVGGRRRHSDRARAGGLAHHPRRAHGRRGPGVALPGTADLPNKRNLRRAERRLGELGEVRFDVVTTGTQLKQALDVFYRLEASGWKGRGGTAVTQRERVKRFYDGLVDRAAVWIPILTVCGDPVAAYLLRVSGPNIFALKTGYDQTYSKYAPGLLLTSRVIRFGLEHGMEMLDLMADNSRWKADWAREVRPHYELLLFAPTPAGRYAYWVRYGVREQAKRLPGAVRLARWLRGAGVLTRNSF
ncbi:MAG: hypothetical protein DMD60_01205 [Gemmatimonadetes bacterium]|nr:MAG: hypothetical protein DMD60_01205 [Gemmatimonadota bacterium]